MVVLRLRSRCILGGGGSGGGGGGGLGRGGKVNLHLSDHISDRWREKAPVMR